MGTSFEGSVVWITGASSGIGLACTQAFAREGARLALAARRIDRLEKITADLAAGGTQAIAIECDVTDETSVQEAVATVGKHFGRLDVVLANAGFDLTGRFDDLTLSDWRRQFEVNVIGVVATAKHALPELRKTQGRLALVASVAAFVYAPDNAAYNASKAAVRALGETLSAELSGSGVSCTTIHPGFVESEIAQIDRLGLHRKDWVDKRPARLMWTAQDAAKVMLRGIHQRKRELIFTGHGKLGVWVARHLPGITARVMGTAVSRRLFKHRHDRLSQ